MKIKIFKIKNRHGYAVTCNNHLTEGKTPEQAKYRMLKALKSPTSVLNRENLHKP